MRLASLSISIVLRVFTVASSLSMLNACLSLSANTDTGPVNLDLENGTVGQVPTGWFVPGPSLQAGYSARLIEDLPRQGRHCGLLSGESVKGSGWAIGNLMQTFDATSYRGRGVRFRAAVRAEVAGVGNQRSSG